MRLIIYDILILLVLAAFALWGMRRGLILTLFSLVSLLVALVGSILITDLLAPTVAGWLEPAVEPTVTAAVEDALPDGWASLSSDQLQQQLEQADLPFGLSEYIEQLFLELPSLDTQTLVENISARLSQQAAECIASVLVFVIFFVLILILWRALARGLNLVTKLPGLHFLNKLGGLVLGAFRGGLVVFLCLWLLQLGGLLPQQAHNSWFVAFFLSFQPL